MRSFLAEVYVSERDPEAVRQAVARLRRAAVAMRKGGTQIRYRRSVFVPEDETCFHLLDSTTAEALTDVGRLAEVPFMRVVEAVALDGARTSSGEGG